MMGHAKQLLSQQPGRTAP